MNQVRALPCPEQAHYQEKETNRDNNGFHLSIWTGGSLVTRVRPLCLTIDLVELVRGMSISAKGSRFSRISANDW